MIRDKTDLGAKCPTAVFEFKMQHGHAKMFELSELKACGGCRSVYYCLKSCQRRGLEDKT